MTEPSQAPHQPQAQLRLNECGALWAARPTPAELPQSWTSVRRRLIRRVTLTCFTTVSRWYQGIKSHRGNSGGQRSVRRHLLPCMLQSDSAEWCINAKVASTERIESLQLTYFGAVPRIALSASIFTDLDGIKPCDSQSCLRLSLSTRTWSLGALRAFSRFDDLYLSATSHARRSINPSSLYHVTLVGTSSPPVLFAPSLLLSRRATRGRQKQRLRWE